MTEPNWHFTSVAQFRSRAGLDAFLYMADMVAAARVGTRMFPGKVVGTLFFEPSTRTRMSFQAATIRLGGNCVDMGDLLLNSQSKGESELDTVANIAEYCDAIIIRHKDDAFVSQFATDDFSTPVIDGGSGTLSHPTQALLDILTVQQSHRRIDYLSWVICGDLLRSRTVRSLLGLLRHCKGVRVTLMHPEGLGLSKVEEEHAMQCMDVRHCTSLEESCRGADVVYMTRLQKERPFAGGEAGPQATGVDYCDYPADFRMNEKCLEALPPDAIVMHPGPCGPEITPACKADGRNVILKQARNGMHVRQTLLHCILSSDGKEWKSWFGGS